MLYCHACHAVHVPCPFKGAFGMVLCAGPSLASSLFANCSLIKLLPFI